MELRLTLLAIGLLLSAGPAGAAGAAADDEPRPATFRIVAVANAAAATPGTRTFLATYGVGVPAARFLIVLDGRRAKGVDQNGAPPPVDISFSNGTFRHVAGSTPGPFLHALAAAVEAKAPKLSQAKADALPFEIAILGAHEGRGPNGGFDGKPGDWVVSKLFLADGAAEVYFNFNPVSGEAEFSIKDEDYGNRVVEEMSKVLW